MNRRKFLKTSVPLGLVPLFAGTLPFKSLAVSSPLVVNTCNVTDRAMVIIYLNGGNDIINTAIPINQMTEYAANRPNIYIPQNQLITLDNSLPDWQQIGLHPELFDFKTLYDSGKLSIVQGVGYEAPSKSHFSSLANWLTGSGGIVGDEKTGWLGRFLNDRYPGYNGNPFIGEPDPLGILFGNMNKTGFHTFEQHKYEINLSGQDPAGFYSLISQLSGAPIANIPNTEFGGMLEHINQVESSVNVYAQRISDTFNNGFNSSISYPSNTLGDQLKTIARMMSGGSRTKIFMATMGGFDNHTNMVTAGSPTTGNHAVLLNRVGTSIKAFQDDLTSLGLADNVITVVFSEFSRKITQNANYGLDHGTLSSMFVIGNGVEGGVVGNNIDLASQDNQGAADPADLQHDYRQVFATLMQDWMGSNDSSLNSTFVASSLYAQKLPLINTSNLVPSSCYYTPVPPLAVASLNVTVMLEGFYDLQQQKMRTNLLSNTLLPFSQPFNNAQFNYGGTETLASFPADTVDWVLLELRDSEDISLVITRKAMLLRDDGTVMATDGTPGVTFDTINSGDYHLAVFHRNHLGILSSEIIPLDAPSYIYNFSLGNHMVAGSGQQKQVGQHYMMIAGDIDGNQVLNNKDHNHWKLHSGATGTYTLADLDGDGDVDAQDYNLWFENRGKMGVLK